MPAYRYSAYDGSGKLRKGVVDAPSSVRAGEILAEKGLVAVDIVEGSPERARRGSPFSLSYHALFCRGLSSYLKRGVPLAEALKFLSRHSTDRKVASACLHLHEGVQGGKRLSAAMEETGVFREDLLRIVESGEKTSALPGVLEQASGLYTLQDRQRRKIRSALTYPLAMTFIGMGVVTFLLVYVVPVLSSLFTEMGRQLPLPTRILRRGRPRCSEMGNRVSGGRSLAFLYSAQEGKKDISSFFPPDQGEHHPFSRDVTPEDPALSRYPPRSGSRDGCVHGPETGAVDRVCPARQGGLPV